MNLRHPYISFGILALALGVVAVGLSLWSVRGGLNLTRCLNENEAARYEVITKGDPGVVRVIVSNTSNGAPEWSRDYSIPSTEHVRYIELHRCGIYIHEGTGYDSRTMTVSPGYYWALMKHSYFTTTYDKGTRIVTFLENPTGLRGEELKPGYSSLFAVSMDEKYIALVRSILGEPDYALVIRDIDTGEDAYVLTLDELMREHPGAAGSFSVGKWIVRPDGEYLVTETYDGPREPVVIYLKAGAWDVEIFDTPRDVKPGVERASPPFAPYLAYTDLTTFAGFQEVADAILEERIASGEPKRLIVADLRAGKSVLVESVPVAKGHRWELDWLSDSELAYTMPDGTRKTYRIE